MSLRVCRLRPSLAASVPRSILISLLLTIFFISSLDFREKLPQSSHQTFLHLPKPQYFPWVDLLKGSLPPSKLNRSTEKRRYNPFSSTACQPINDIPSDIWGLFPCWLQGLLIKLSRRCLSSLVKSFIVLSISSLLVSSSCSTSSARRPHS